MVTVQKSPSISRDPALFPVRNRRLFVTDFSVGRAVHTANAPLPCSAAVRPGLLSGRSQQCCSPVCSPAPPSQRRDSDRDAALSVLRCGPVNTSMYCRSVHAPHPHGLPSVATSLWQLALEEHHHCELLTWRPSSLGAPAPSPSLGVCLLNLLRFRAWRSI